MSSLQRALLLLLSVPLLILLAVAAPATAQSGPAQVDGRSARVTFRQAAGRIQILLGDRPIATYVYHDPKIPRPYFAHVKAPNGVQVTRNHPPLAGQDRVDHDTMHPGIWMAFGDLDGSDFWRNKARVAHLGFSREPTGGAGGGSFIEQKEYRRADQTLVCSERFVCGVHARQNGFLLVWDSTFSSDDEFYFGDQEEMGLGLRVATPISEVKGGRLTDAQGRKGAKAIWSQSAKWCDYSAVVDGRRLGMTLMCHPENFRESWMHARDYGLVAANPFGRKAMGKGERSKVVVRPGDRLRLRYAIWIHSQPADQAPAVESVYAEYLTLAE